MISAYLEVFVRDDTPLVQDIDGRMTLASPDSSPGGLNGAYSGSGRMAIGGGVCGVCPDVAGVPAEALTSAHVVGTRAQVALESALIYGQHGHLDTYKLEIFYRYLLFESLQVNGVLV